MTLSLSPVLCLQLRHCMTVALSLLSTFTLAATVKMTESRQPLCWHVFALCLLSALLTFSLSAPLSPSLPACHISFSISSYIFPFLLLCCNFSDILILIPHHALLYLLSSPSLSAYCSKCATVTPNKMFCSLIDCKMPSSARGWHAIPPSHNPASL